MKRVILTAKNLQNVINTFKEKINDNYISLVYMVNSTDLIISFSRLRDHFLFISLNGNQPFLGLIKQNNHLIKPITHKYNDYLKKYIKDSHIENIKQINNDRILEIEVLKSNPIFEREKFYIILEFIPRNTNLIVLNNERKIIYAFKYKSLENPHPILNGMTYQEPNLVTRFQDESDFSNYEEYAKYLYKNAIEKRRKETFKPLYQYLNTRIHQIDKKIYILQNEINDLKNIEKDKTIGNTLLTLSYDDKSLKEYINKSNIAYDEAISCIENANKYFKKYKKGKKKIIENTKQISIAEEEYNDLVMKLNMCEYLNDDELYDLMSTLKPSKEIKKKNKKETFPSIKIRNNILYFGKNASQNNELTFKFAKKDWIFFHIKDYHGPHVVLNCPNPDNKTLDIASKIALALSNKAAGDINMAKIDDIKRGENLGQVILKKYTTITIKNIEQEIYDLMKNN